MNGAAAEAPDGIHGPRWVIRSYAAARSLLRSEADLRQAGFGALTFIKPADATTPGSGPGPRRSPRPPVLYLNGPAHRDRRRAAARFFTPRAVDAYRPLVEDLVDALLAPLEAGRRADVSRLSLEVAVAVVAKVSGLTSSLLPGIGRRIASTFTANLADSGQGPAVWVRRSFTAAALFAFYVLDVRPAIRARRRRRGDDLISHLLDLRFTPLEILTECLIYCAAGMATTREFVTLAAWRLLDSPELLARYRAADTDGRVEMLQEILRLEPVVGHLYRRTVAATTITVQGTSTVVPAGAIIDLDLRAINSDTALVGAEPLALWPGRPLSERSAGPAVLGFGEGQHRCPGAPLALLESEILLTRLLHLDLTLLTQPTLAWSSLTGGYDLRRLVVSTRRPNSPRRRDHPVRAAGRCRAGWWRSTRSLLNARSEGAAWSNRAPEIRRRARLALIRCDRVRSWLR